jgi:hypothetical protein
MRKHNEFTTPFWNKASKSLPASVRQRYKSQLQAAEGFELALERIIGLFSHRSAH